MTDEEGPRGGILFWEEIKRPATAIASVLGVVGIIAGILTSYYFYKKSDKMPEISLQSEQLQIFEKQSKSGGRVPLTVHDEAGNLIDSNIFVASVTIWNSGNAEIKKEDVRQPFRFTVNGSATKVIEISPTFFTNNNIDKFSIDTDGELNWQHFDAGEGFKLRVIYANPTMENIALSGYAVGAKIIDTMKLENRKYEVYRSVNLGIMIGFGVMIVGTITVGILTPKTLRTMFVWADITGAGMAIVIILWWIVFMVSKSPKPPF
jgi:hypothetical protein